MTAQEVDLRTGRRIHIVGIGGAGMSAMAEVLAAMGHTVSGSDARSSAVTERLAALGLRVFIGHDAGQVEGAEIVTLSSAVTAGNPEVAAAHRGAIPVLSRAAMLRAISGLRRVAAIAGTHGKTTTSAFLAGALASAGARPSWIVGAAVRGLGSGGRWDQGQWMVVEADESDGTFLDIGRDLALVTSVEADHLEHHGTMATLVDAFSRFLDGCSGPRLVCADDPVAESLGRSLGARTYGTSEGAHYRIQDLQPGRQGISFQLLVGGDPVGTVTSRLPGAHNARNAAGAVAAALEMGEAFVPAVAGVGSVAGVARRFEWRGTRDGVDFVDDYAHLPGEVSAALAAATDGAWNRIVCVFQPHRYSRTEALWTAFAPAFDGADLLVVTDVYPAGEQPRPGISGLLVADEARKRLPSRPVEYVADRSALGPFLRNVLEPGDLCLTLGAGDLTTLAEEFVGGD